MSSKKSTTLVGVVHADRPAPGTPAELFDEIGEGIYHPVDAQPVATSSDAVAPNDLCWPPLNADPATAATNSEPTEQVPVSTAAPVKTYETDETYAVSNSEFMLAVFGAQDNSALSPPNPVLVSFGESPATAPRKAWIGKAWTGEAAAANALPADANNYTTLATFSPDESGKTRRRKDNFVSLHAVMLDDLGTKVAFEQLRLQPSWLLETSAANYQAGFILDAPLTDRLEADRLMKEIIVAGLCDPGAGGPCARLVRLPMAVNAKSTPAFVCRMAMWSPELRYSVAEIRSGFELVPASKSRPAKLRTPAALQDGSEAIWIPRPKENGVLAALRSRGHYKADLGNGKHDITCPWVDEHTGEVDGGTAYFEPEDNWPAGGFKCFHGHCADRRLRDLLDFLGVDLATARMKPTIRVMAGELEGVVDAAERELAQTHYQRGGVIVTIVTDPGTRETRVQDMNLPALVRALAGIAWERFDSRSKEWSRTDPPARHAGVLFESTSYKHLPVLCGLARQPYLRPDGSLMQTPGYDSATGMYGVFEQGEFCVPDLPTLADAQAALEVISEPLTEFSFASAADRATALAAILTATVRPSLGHAPMVHVRAPMVGSGKSYLCELFTAFATPQRGTPTTFPADDEECRKLLLAELMRGPAVIEFDNLTSDLLAHKSLCTALTSESISGRILGVSRTATVSTSALFLSSGNNVGPVRDMARRCITVNLDPGCEVPAARTFTRPDLVREVLSQRGRYVSAALTVVRAWVVAGRPKSQCKSFAGFGDWSDLCRQPLLWLGLPDPAESVFKAMAEDPDRETLGRLLTAWHDAFGKTATMVRDAVSTNTAYSSVHQELREVLRDIADERGDINRRKLGWWIRRHAGRIVGGRRFVRGSSRRSAETWQVETVTTATTGMLEVHGESVSQVVSVLVLPDRKTGSAKTRVNGHLRVRGD